MKKSDTKVDTKVDTSFSIDRSVRADLTPVYMIAANGQFLDREFTREELISVSREIDDLLCKEEQVLVSEFLQEKMAQLYQDFPILTIHYKEDKDGTHLIAILPLDVYKNHVDFIEAESDIVSEFNERFPGLELSFVSTDSYYLFDLDSSTLVARPT